MINPTKEYLIYILEGCGYGNLERDIVLDAHFDTILAPPPQFDITQSKWEKMLIEMLQIHFLLKEPFYDLLDMIADLSIPEKYLYDMVLTRLRLLVDYIEHRKD